MDEHAATPARFPPPLPGAAPPPLRLPEPPSTFQRIRKLATPIAVTVVVLLKGGAKLKFVAPLLKFVPVVIKTGGSMFVTIWVYAMAWGAWFAIGFVLPSTSCCS
jgi:hypothetical protein